MPAAVPSNEEIAARVQQGSNIWIATADGDFGRVKLLLEHGDVSPVSGDMVKYTPIHAAASYGRADLLRFLLTYPNVPNDAVNVRDEDGDTPLFFCEDVETAKLLVTEFNADAQIKNDEGLTVRIRFTQAAQKALLNEHEALADYLRSVSGEVAVSRSELLAQLGEEEDEEQELPQHDEDADVDAKADQIMEHVQRIMQEADATGTDPSEQLRGVVSASLVKQILEGYDQDENEK